MSDQEKMAKFVKVFQKIICEMFRGQTVWDRDVEVFELTNHPKAKRACAWSYEDETKGEKFTAVLGAPPIHSALDAVKATVVAETKGRK